MIHVNKELLVVSFWCVASCSFVVVDDDEEEDEDEDGDDEDEDEDENEYEYEDVDGDDGGDDDDDNGDGDGCHLKKWTCEFLSDLEPRCHGISSWMSKREPRCKIAILDKPTRKISMVGSPVGLWPIWF